MNNLFSKLIEALKRLEIVLKNMNNTELLYITAKNLLGKDISPTQDELGCVESIGTIFKQIFNTDFGIGLSTIQADGIFNNRTDLFERVSIPEKGTIIISITKGNNYGHIGICGRDRKTEGQRQIMSNNSRTSLFDTYFTLDKWINYYTGKGLETKYYKKI